MSEMIERAARAFATFGAEPRVWDDIPRGAQEANCAIARAALSAALDPEDEKLRAEVRYVLEMLYGKVLSGDEARVIAALKAHALGVTDA